MQDKSKVWVAVIAGGLGTRLFPLSHSEHPKQFCALNNEGTFIQATVRRFLDLGIRKQRIVVVTTSATQRALADEQLGKLGVLEQNIMLISPHYDYAGAMLKAAEFIRELDRDAVIINTPADQYIEADEGFGEAIWTAVDAAAEDFPVLVGVEIRDEHTMRECGHAKYDTGCDDALKPVLGFVEKPSKEEAEKMLREGNTVCNTGINVWSARLIYVATAFIDKSQGLATDELMDLLRKKRDLRVVVGKFVWRDCGTLKSLWEVSEKTPHHRNVRLGGGASVRNGCRGSLFVVPKGVSLDVTGIVDSAVIVNTVQGKLVVAVISLASSKMRELVDEWNKNQEILRDHVHVGALNNVVSPTAFSREIATCFVDVSDCHVTATKSSDGGINIVVARGV